MLAFETVPQVRERHQESVIPYDSGLGYGRGMKLYCELLNLWVALKKPRNVDEMYVMTYHKNHQGGTVRPKLWFRRAVTGSCWLRAAPNPLKSRQAGGRTRINNLSAWCLCQVARRSHQLGRAMF